MKKALHQTTYRVQGFTCSDCASRFEQNVKALPGVQDAKVNFGASKITVSGEISRVELERAGSFENLKVSSERESTSAGKGTFWLEQAHVLLSILFLLAGWWLGHQFGAGGPLSVAAYTASILVGGFRLFKTGLANLFRFQFDMKTLMTVAILGAAAIGEWGEGAVVVILFAISEALEGYSMEKARQSIRSLMKIAPKEASIRQEKGERRIPVEDIQVGDRMIVKPGEKLAMDGLIKEGTSSIHQAAITGESVPVFKTVGDPVYAGTLNGDGLLEVQVTKKAEDTTIAKIIHLVEEAQAERAPSQAFVDRFARIYTPAIMMIALLVAVLPPLFLSGEWNEWVYRGLAVLVVGCPCALVISTPVTIVTAIGWAARQGVLIKGGIYLEEAASLSVIAFDKTGTLTKGTPEVTDVQELGQHSPQEWNKRMAIIAALERNSQHPLATAILRWANGEGLDGSNLQVSHVFSLPGLGIKGEVEQTEYYVGNPSLFQRWLPHGLESDIQEKVKELQKEGKTVILAGTKQEIFALIAVADPVRENSTEVIQNLSRLGIKKALMLTGDNEAAAAAIGNRVGISEVQAELLPQEKLAYIKRLKDQGNRVAMVGDGVNDAPALAASTVGIAMGGAGSDTALETADIALMADDLRRLPYTIQLSRKALRIIKENITFSILIKAIALLLILPGWLTLWMAIFADMGATLLVLLNALRVLRIKEEL